MSEEPLNPLLRRLTQHLSSLHGTWVVLPGGDAVRCRCGHEVLRCTQYQQNIRNGDLCLDYRSYVFRASADSPLIDRCPGCGEILDLSVKV